MDLVTVEGPLQQCHDQVKSVMKKKQYSSLDECFQKIVCPDLNVSEVIQLYTCLKFELDEEEIIKIGTNKVDNFSRGYTLSRSRWVSQVEDFYG